jgi:hypothetical protein
MESDPETLRNLLAHYKELLGNVTDLPLRAALTELIRLTEEELKQSGDRP